MKISSVDIRRFRGVTNTLVINFCRPKDSKAKSLILLGDNGSGKSTIVDALEFVLQARIQRSSKLKGIRSLGAEADTKVSVVFDDETSFTRFVSKEGEKLRVNDNKPHKNFSVSPVVLRRSDILLFWNTKAIERMVVFFDFFRKEEFHDRSWEPRGKEQLQDLEYERLQLKKQRRECVFDLAERIQVDPEDIPSKFDQFDQFVTTYVYQGLSVTKHKKLQRRGTELTFDLTSDQLVKDIRRLREEIVTLNSEINKLRKKFKKPTSVLAPSQDEIAEILARTGNNLTKAFRAISPSKDLVNTIELQVADETAVSLSVGVRLKNGLFINPVNFFSEANLDLLALLLYLTFYLESVNHGQAKVLILDDVLQSVDATVRLRTMEWLLANFQDWQLIITAHERLWSEQLRSLFLGSGHAITEKQILEWNFHSGPIVRELDSPTLGIQLKKVLSDADSVRICSVSGLVLEEIANILSYTLPVSVTRRKGDKYTLGDLWPGVLKKLKKTKLKDAAIEINRWIHLRNLVGAHYNEWALNLSLREAQDFGNAVKNLFDSVYCSNCGHWIEAYGPSIGAKEWRCRCNKLILD